MTGSVSTKTYGQFCGLATALELVGERWALLVVRELIHGPRRFTDLRQALPRIPTNVLASRLKEFEAGGIVCRRVQPRPATSVTYELTDNGQDLRQVVLTLGAWGARAMGPAPRPEEVMTPGALMLALEGTFQPRQARGLRAGYELRVGPIVIHARIARGRLATGPGPLPGADVVIEAGPAFKSILSGELSPDAARRQGAVKITGDAALFRRFAEVFTIGPPPPPAEPSGGA
jgi:DNA-binding HxlR family transcriptional regulator